MKDYSNAFADLSLNSKQKAYVDYHIVRYNFLMVEVMDLLKKVKVEKGKEDLRILDIGPSFQTYLMRKCLPKVTINTLGFRNSFNNLRPHEYHMDYDLNTCHNSAIDRKEDHYDIVVFCEVLEHLYTSPHIVLNFIKSFMSNPGYLIIQTPNAVALPNRFKMLVGKNPFMLIRENQRNPGHFREYTLEELSTYLKNTCFKMVKAQHKNYFNGDSIIHKVYNYTSLCIPPGMKQGITIVAKKGRAL